MIIDLRKYQNELDAIHKAAAQFVNAESAHRLKAVVESLQSSVEKGAKEFFWGTEKGKAIVTKVARRYDSRDTDSAHAVVAALGFHGKFERQLGKGYNWSLSSMVTHIEVFKEGEETKEAALHIHVDKRNKDQLGPDIHLQVSEEYIERKGGFKLAVPRIPFAFVLPTDCLDFVLAEFFPEEWGKAQVGAHGIKNVLDGQLFRATEIGKAVKAKFDKEGRHRSPISVLQDCSFDTGLRLN